MMTVLLINCYIYICDNQIEVRFEMRSLSLHDYFITEVKKRVKKEVEKEMKKEMKEEVKKEVKEEVKKEI